MMGRFVRVVSLGFAVFSVIFWLAVDSIGQMLRHITEGEEISNWDIWFTSSVPAIIYAVICVLVFHWFARKIIKKIGQQ